MAVVCNFIVGLLGCHEEEVSRISQVADDLWLVLCLLCELLVTCVFVFLCKLCFWVFLLR